MLSRRLCIVATLLAATLSGCNWINSLRKNTDTDKSKLETKPANDFVGFLNRQSGYINTVRYDSVSMNATMPGQFIPRLNSGIIVASKPNSFRMQAGLPIGGDQLDVGANSQEFWMFVKQSEPKYLYCSLTDFPKVQEKLPVPFEPEWVMQALGMTTYPENKSYRIENSDRDHAYYLSWEDTTASGQKVLKVVEFAGERADSRSPQVRRHLILSPKKDGGWETVAIAEIKQVETKELGFDRESGQANYVQIPTQVILEWPTQKMKMELNLGRIKLNEKLTPQEQTAMFVKPAKLDNSTPVNLADLRFNAAPISTPRGAYPRDLPRVESRRR